MNNETIIDFAIDWTKLGFNGEFIKGEDNRTFDKMEKILTLRNIIDSFNEMGYKCNSNIIRSTITSCLISIEWEDNPTKKEIVNRLSKIADILYKYMYHDNMVLECSIYNKTSNVHQVAFKNKKGDK